MSESPIAILNRARSLGLQLTIEAGRIAIRPARLCPPELLQAIRREKTALLDLLAEAKNAHLPPDCVPWLHIARQILAGEFDAGDRSLLDSLLIGVRNRTHPACQAARARLEIMLGHNRKESRR